MPELRRCVCGKDFWFPGERWQHLGCAINKVAINDAINENGKKSVEDDRADKAEVGGEPVVDLRSGPRVVGGSGAHGDSAIDRQRASSERSANGRSREAYNAYMREYMRKRRALSG